MFQKIVNFFNEVRKEFRNVGWPKKEEIVGSTMMVILVTTILSLFLFVVDKVLEKVILLIL